MLKNSFHKIVLCWLALFMAGKTAAQFSPQATFSGSVAIHKDDSRFVAWATDCSSRLGWQNISDTALGKVSVGSDFSAVGKADNAVLSLGDRGEAVLHFQQAALVNGIGADFAVFENGFFAGSGQEAFLELATVAVSEDGIRFVQFAPVSLLQYDTQMAMQGTDSRLLHNLAGNFIANYGTPFDLEELKDSLNVNNIHYIKITDVVGSIQPSFATFDKNNHPINDPFPTPFPSSGFDLDAVGVIHQATPNAVSSVSDDFFWYIKDGTIYFTDTVHHPVLLAINGTVVADEKNAVNMLKIDGLAVGIYIIHFSRNGVLYTLKIVL